jgi:hypothetical protein
VAWRQTSFDLGCAGACHIGDGVVVEPFSVRVRVEGSVVEDGVAPDVDLSRPPSCDGNHWCHGGSFAAPQRRNDLNRSGNPTGDQLVQEGRIELRAERGIAPFSDLCDGGKSKTTLVVAAMTATKGTAAKPPR